jgi:hypothetical protein
VPFTSLLDLTMVLWFSEKKDLRLTPSQVSGMPYEVEMRYRREGARFIIELGKAMGLSHNTMASGAVYFHRFYLFHTFKEFPKYVSRPLSSLEVKRSGNEMILFLFRSWPPAACFLRVRLRRRPKSARTSSGR